MSNPRHLQIHGIVQPFHQQRPLYKRGPNNLGLLGPVLWVARLVIGLRSGFQKSLFLFCGSEWRFRDGFSKFEAPLRPTMYRTMHNLWLSFFRFFVV